MYTHIRMEQLLLYSGVWVSPDICKLQVILFPGCPHICCAMHSGQKGTVIKRSYIYVCFSCLNMQCIK